MRELNNKQQLYLYESDSKVSNDELKVHTFYFQASRNWFHIILEGRPGLGLGFEHALRRKYFFASAFMKANQYKHWGTG